MWSGNVGALGKGYIRKATYAWAEEYKVELYTYLWIFSFVHNANHERGLEPR